MEGLLPCTSVLYYCYWDIMYSQISLDVPIQTPTKMWEMNAVGYFGLCEAEPPKVKTRSAVLGTQGRRLFSLFTGDL